MNKTCPSREQLLAVVNGDAAADQLSFYESHLSECEVCIRDIQVISADPDLWDDICTCLRDNTTSIPSEHVDATEPSTLELGQLQSLLGPTDDPSMVGRIGSYEIVGLLGRGGMGAVFKALDRSLNRYVAIKLLQPHVVTSGAARARFAREAQAAAAVVDDHVMPILSVDSWQGMPYLVMPYYRGCSLQQRISEQGALGLREVLRIAMQAARALAAAHEQGIIHRDVKPANILLDAGVERARLMDFGLARAVDDATLTRSGSITGTPQFMSPEQVRGESLDPRSDLFSLGAVIYAMCTGQAPFRAETSYAVLRRITDHDPRPIREWNPEIPAWLEKLVTRLMAKSPLDRIQSAREAAQLLEDCLAHTQRPMDNPLPEVVLIQGYPPAERALTFVAGMMLTAGAIVCAIIAAYSLRLSLVETTLIITSLLVSIFAARHRIAALLASKLPNLTSIRKSRTMKLLAIATLVSTFGGTGAWLLVQQTDAPSREANDSAGIPMVVLEHNATTGQNHRPVPLQALPPAFLSIQSLVVDLNTPLDAEVQTLIMARKPAADFKAAIDRLIEEKKAKVVAEQRHPKVLNRGAPISFGYSEWVNWVVEPSSDGYRATLRISEDIVKIDVPPGATVKIAPEFTVDLRYGVAEIIGPFETGDENRVRLIQLTVDKLSEASSQNNDNIPPRATPQPPKLPEVSKDKEAAIEAAKRKHAPIAEVLKDQSLTPVEHAKRLREIHAVAEGRRQNATDLTGQPAPPLSLTRWTDSNQERTLADFIGKVVYIEFTRTGYEPGRTATPSVMKKLADKYAGEVVFVCITSPATTDEQVGVQMQRDGWPRLWGIDQSVDEENFLGKTARAFQVTAYPEFVVLDRAGRVATSSLAEHRRMTADVAKQAYEEIAGFLDRPWPPTEPLSATEFLEINLKLEEYRVEKAIRLALAATNPPISAHDQIRALGLVQGNRVTDSVDTRFPIRIEGQDGFTDDRIIRHNETRLFEFPEPVAEARWKCGDYQPESIDDIEPFDNLLVEWLEDKLVMTIYRRPRSEKVEPSAAKPQSTSAPTTLETRLFEARERQDLIAKLVAETRLQVQQGKAEETPLIELIRELDTARKEVLALESEQSTGGLRWSRELGAQTYIAPANQGFEENNPIQSAVDPVSVGKMAPDWTVSSWSDSQVRSLKELRGKVVVLDFLATSCGPCVVAIPAWRELQAKHKTADVVFLGIHTAGIDKGEIEQFLEQKDWNIPVGIDIATADEPGSTLNRYGVTGLPSTVIIDQNGRIAFSDIAAGPSGETSRAELEAIATAEGIPWPLDKDADDAVIAQRANKLRFAVLRRTIDGLLMNTTKPTRHGKLPSSMNVQSIARQGPAAHPLEGQWTIREIRGDGVLSTAAELKGMRWEITGDIITATDSDGSSGNMQFKIDESEPWIDIISFGANNEITKTELGIYSLDGDVLKICLAEQVPGVGRPRAFAANAQSWIMELRRANPGATIRNRQT